MHGDVTELDVAQAEAVRRDARIELLDDAHFIDGATRRAGMGEVDGVRQRLIGWQELWVAEAAGAGDRCLRGGTGSQIEKRLQVQ